MGTIESDFNTSVNYFAKIYHNHYIVRVANFQILFNHRVFYFNLCDNLEN
jgi:hypothetical protein